MSRLSRMKKKNHTHPEDGDKTQHTDGVKRDETTHE